jgi:hypothetical protein
VVASRAAGKALVGAALLALPCCGTTDEPSPRIGEPLPNKLQVYINEVMPTNTAAAYDEHNEGDDWIELYNAGDEDANLEGCFVSDDPSDLRKHELPAEVVVPARGMLLLWADRQLSQGPRHLDLALDGDGDYLWLAAPADDADAGPDPQVLDHVWFSAPTDTMYSYARFPDAGEE